MEELKQEIEKIKQRNTRVEGDKARETSRARKLSIAVLTYAVIVIFFYTAELPKPLINAIVPTLGFLLSTLSLWVIKNIRAKRYKQK